MTGVISTLQDNLVLTGSEIKSNQLIVHHFQTIIDEMLFDVYITEEIEESVGLKRSIVEAEIRLKSHCHNYIEKLDEPIEKLAEVMNRLGDAFGVSLCKPFKSIGDIYLE